MFNLYDDPEIDNLTKAYEAEYAVGANLCVRHNKMIKKQYPEERDDCPGDDFPVTPILTPSRQERKERQNRWKAKTLMNWIKNLPKVIVKCFHRWVNCTRDVHCDVTHFDDKGFVGKWKCNICGDHNPPIVWPKPPVKHN